MTDFHKLFMVKIIKMIEKKTGASFFLGVYTIYGSLVHIDSKKTVSCLLPRLPVSHPGGGGTSTSFVRGCVATGLEN